MSLSDGNLHKDMVGQSVANLHYTLDKLGFSIPVAETSCSFFGDGTHQAVQNFQKTHGLEPSGAVDEKTAEKLGIEEAWLKSTRGPAQANGQTSMLVQGKVTDQTGVPFAGLTVKAFDRNVGVQDALLGQAATDTQGRYSVAYTLQQLQGKPEADLVVAVLQDGRQLQSSDVIFNARPVEIKDFAIPVAEKPEMQRIAEKIYPLVPQTIGRGGLTQAQIRFLGQKTGVDPQKIGRLAQSRALSGGDDTLATFYYGLLAQNFPTDPAALLRRPRASIEPALARAAVGNQILRLQPAQIDNILDTVLPRLRAENLLKPVVPGQPAPLGDVLKTMPQALSDADQLKVAGLVAQNGVRYGQLPDQLKAAGFSPEQATAIERTLRLADVTLSHPPLMRRLQQMTAKDPDGSLKSLTALRRDQWIDLAYAFGVPAGWQQTSEEYGRQLETAVEKLHPTAMLAARLACGDLVIRRPGFAEVGPFLNNNPDFDILYSNLPVYAGKANFNGVENPGRLVKSLLQLQRVKRLSASWDEAGAMLNGGLTSALDVVSAGPSRLVQYLSGQVAPERALGIYQRAQSSHDICLMLMSGLLPRFAPTPVAALGAATRVPEMGKAFDAGGGGGNYPTLQSLFGSLDSAGYGCDQTVLSPAAYYVDLLQFLNTKQDEPTPNPLLALLLRRPDLVDIKLSAASVEIELPYIDLVLEILENAVVGSHGFDLPGVDVDAALLADPLTSPITDALQASSLGTIGTNLKAFEESTDQRRLTNDFGNIWIVDDGQRRWTLYGQNTITWNIKVPGEPPVQTVLSPQAIGLLNKGTLPDDVGNLIEPLVQQRANARYLGIADYTVTSLTPGLKWRINCRLGADVLVSNNAGQSTVTIKSPGGREAIHDTYSPASGKAVLSGLQKGTVCGPLRGLIPPPPGLSVGPIKSDGAYPIVSEPIDIVIIGQEPAYLAIMAVSYQTVGQSEELIACPENQNPIAYEILRNPDQAVFPWSLPFSLPWESVRACLARAGIPRRRLMELANPEHYLADLNVTREVLGLSGEVAALICQNACIVTINCYHPWPQGISNVRIVNRAKPRLWQYWGVGTGGVWDADAGTARSGLPMDLLTWASVIVQQARISFEDMLRVLHTRFVASVVPAAFPIEPPTEYHLSALQVDQLRPGHLDRMHRFIRLWKTTGWAIEDLDMALGIFQFGQGANGTTITWSSSDTGVISDTGEVLRPDPSQGPAKVSLTATIAKGAARPETVQFPELTVLPQAGSDAAALSVGLEPGDTTAKVTQDLFLPFHGANGSTIVWTANPPDVQGIKVISGSGQVTRPAHGQGDVTVALVATVSKGSHQTTVSAGSVTVLELPADPVNRDAAYLQTLLGPGGTAYIPPDSPSSVTRDLFLPCRGPNGSTIAWMSDHPQVVAADGTVNRPDPGCGLQVVTLTAAVSCAGAAPVSPQFKLTVPPAEPTDAAAVAADKAALYLPLAPQDTPSGITTNLNLFAFADFAATLQCLSHIQRLQELLGLGINTLLSWWGGPSTLLYRPYAPPGQAPAKSLYEQIFLNPRVQNPPDEAFVLDPERTGLLHSCWLREKVQPISAVLGLGPNDQQLLLDLESYGEKVTLANLFELYRITSLARALGLSIPDYLSAVGLTAFAPTSNRFFGAEPFADTATLVEFCTAVQFIQDSGFGIQEVASLLYKVDPADAMGLTSDQMAQMLKTIRSALQAKLASLEPQVRNFITANPGGPTVLRVLTGSAAVAADAAALAIVFAPGDSAAGVTRDLKLPLGGPNGATVTWAVSGTNPPDLSNVLTIPQPSAGASFVTAGVSRPPAGSVDAVVTLTATVGTGSSPNAVQTTKSFTLVVLKALTPAEAVAADAASAAIGFQPGDSAAGVTRDLKLPLAGPSGTQISWTPDAANPGVITLEYPPDPAVPYALGHVARPPAGGSDAAVNLTATVSAGSPPNAVQTTKSFALVVLKTLAPQDAVAADAAGLAIIFRPGESAAGVTRDLELPLGGPNGTQISWTADNTHPGVITVEEPNAAGKDFAVGQVVRPPAAGLDIGVTLTAAIGRPDAKASVTKVFPLTVLKEMTDDQAVAADAAALTIRFRSGDSDSCVTGPFGLPLSGANGTLIQWTASDPAVITLLPDRHDPSEVIADVKRPTGDSDANVILTAVVQKNKSSATRVFYPRALLDLAPLDARRLPPVLALTDPNNAQGLDIHSLLADVVEGQVAGLFGLATPVTRRLLTATVTQDPSGARQDNPAILKDPLDATQDAISVFFDPAFLQQEGTDTPGARELMFRLKKVSVLLSRLKVKPSEIDWIAPPHGMVTLDFNALPLPGEEFPVKDLFSGWRKLVTLYQMRDQIPNMGALLGQYVAELGRLQSGSSDPLPVLAALVGQGLGLPVGLDYDRIAAGLEINGLADYRNPLKLAELVNLLGAMKKLGATIDDVGLLIQAWPEPDPGNPAADRATQAEKTARALLRAKYGADSWNAVVKPISDGLRVRQRDALVDYLVALNSLRDATELYDYYLIDTQMSPHMLTSRLVQATAAVQLFVQRCLLNLETAHSSYSGQQITIQLSEDDRARWEWMKNYRVWQANREVFLFPENWLFPELRDDKTETFKALQSGLSQGEPKDQLAVDNVLNYLDELNDISKITVYGMYESCTSDKNPVRTLYIVGRSPNQPYSYYWRQCTAFGDVNNMNWSGWEKILDITDDHVMPFVMENDLHIAWPAITKTTKATDPNREASESSYWKIDLNWIRRTNNGWTKKKVSKESMPLPNGLPIDCSSASDADREITFRIELDQDQENIIFCVFQNKGTMNPTIDQSVGKTQIPPDQTAKVSLNSGQHYAGLYNVFLNNYKQGLGQNLGPVTFTIYPYERVITTEPLPYYYLTATATSMYFYLYANVYNHTTGNYVTVGPWRSEMDAFPGQDDQGIKGSVFQFQPDWETFETIFYQYARQNPDLNPDLNPDPNQYPPYLSRLTVVYEGNVIVDQPFTSNTAVVDTLSQKVILNDVISSWQLMPVGRFILNVFGDITVDLPASSDAPPPINARFCYANGYFVYDDGSGLQLTTDDSQVFLVPNIHSPGMVIPAVRQEAPDNKYLWYFDYSPALTASSNTQSDPFKLYIYGVITDNNPNQKWENANLEVLDNILSTAALRAKTNPTFDNLYLPANQQSLQDDNFNWSNFADIHNIDNSDWAGFETLNPTGFAPQVPFSLYNWELLYHAPMLAAELFIRQQRFADAQKWLHYIFNPTKPDATPDNQGNPIPVAAQFWRFLPFRQTTIGSQPTPANEDSLQQLFDLLAEAAADPNFTPPEQDKEELAQFTGLIDDWKRNPFLPFRIARVPIRWLSFQWRTLFAYLDNLLAWGDQMFRSFTRESINEALQYYILAGKLLGPRPKTIRPQALPPPQSYRDLCDKWDDFSNAWYAFGDNPLVWAAWENNRMVQPAQSSAATTLTSLGMLYFGIPANDKLMGYWDTVEDRLFKIRNCMDIDGVARELPLFSPPIDPGLLVRAAAAGLDIDTVLADLDTPALPYRFNIVVQKASELCAEVKSLGTALLTALEKNDAEGLALLRSGQEVALLNLVTEIKQRQVDEASANIDSLNQSMSVAMARFTQYQKLLGQTVALDSGGLPVLSAASSLRLAANPSGEEAGLGLIQYEVDQLESLDAAHSYQEAAGIISTIAGVLHAIPESQTGFLAEYLIIGGTHFGNAANAVTSFLNILANNASHEANRKSLFATYQRRQDEWVFQSRLALEDMKQINKQLIAAQIRLDIAQKELDNHLKQIDNAQAVDDFLHDKYTNQELYSWMVGRISSVYFSCYQLAYDTAKRAEKAFRNDLGLDDSNFIQFGYWDNLKKGLLAGENLSLDLKRMEVAYLEQNTRQFEIVKNISLLELNPLALVELRQDGECEFTIPEILFDLDFPGQYFRRLKSVSLTIPCIVGPYTGVSCTLNLQKHSYRRTPQVGVEGYPRQANAQGIPTDDARFVDGTGAVQSIATSHAQNDCGMFELNFRDERYLPFEGAGAISTWRIELPKVFRQFDYNTISDVILHLRYTALRDGGLAEKVNQYLNDKMDQLMRLPDIPDGFSRLFSLRHEFVNEWYTFATNVSKQNTTINLGITSQRFPIFCMGKEINISLIDIVVSKRINGVVAALSPDELTDLNVNLEQWNSNGISTIGTAAFNVFAPTGSNSSKLQSGNQIQLTIDLNQSNIVFEDIILICHYDVKPTTM